MPHIRNAGLRRWGHYLKPDASIEWTPSGLPRSPIMRMTPGMQANALFFSHPKWGGKYFDCENHPGLIADRWLRATGSWDDKVVVDMGCGPGNLGWAMHARPKALIGVDISEKALKHAATLGYMPLYADVHDTPLASGCADLVVANAVLHHIDDVAQVLRECARLVKPGGMLVTDEDPLRSDHAIQGAGKLISKLRGLVPLSRVKLHPTRKWKYTSFREQRERLKTEVHFQYPGDGIERGMFAEVLEPLGFSVRLYPHGHVAGPEIMSSDRGSNTALLRLAQRASGVDPDASDLQLSVMCVAVRNLE
ncbi:MAG: class I SAM-dependent methyltransferase [Aquabacterium sp.]|nr:class I SAM-dependent methyltransferase [Aquabacterium sp.]